MTSEAAKALLNGLHFAGGVARLGTIPATTDSTVRLDDASGFESLEPGEAGLLPFDEDNPHAPGDASEAVLLQFGDEARHVAVPTSESVAGLGDLNLAFDLDTSVCAELCNRRYSIELHAAIELESGGIGALHETEVMLDCRARGSAAHCASDEQSEPPAPSVNEPPPDAGSDAGSEAPTAAPDAGPGPDPVPTSTLIGLGGGSVSLPNGAEAVIPAMALAEPTAIALQLAGDRPALPSGLEGASEAYAFEPHGTTFDEPVTIRLPFQGSASGASVLRLDDDDDETWEEADGTPSFEDGVAELEVMGFSIYQVVRPTVVTVDDPCEDDNGGCDTDPMATCEPDGDTRTCECPSGYDGDGVGDDGCEDALECDTDNGGCEDDDECIEQVGDDPICDFDECTVSNGSCGDATYNSCDNQLDGDPPICADIDECATDNGGCGDATYVDCVDMVGGFDCIDIDECATNNGGCGDATYIDCVDNDAAAHTCEDIDECAIGNGGCGAPAYSVCVDNYAAVHTCMDVDQCATNNGTCGDPLEVLCTDRGNDPPQCTRLWGQVDVSDGPMCARRRDGTIACAGYNYSGGLVTAEMAASTDVIDIAAGQGNACTLHADNHITCYGTADSAQTTAANTDPTQNFVDIEIGGYRLCALRSTGVLSCFGATNEGNGTANVLAFDVTWSHACVVYTDKTLQCFGTNTNGCVAGPNAEPGNPSDPDNRYVSVATGTGGTCALRENGTFICWGSASATHITGANADNEFDYVALSMGQAHTCGLHSDGTATCWGADTNGVMTALNVTENGGDLEQIGVGDYGICVLRTDGSMHCHGSNTYGFQGLNPQGVLP